MGFRSQKGEEKRISLILIKYKKVVINQKNPKGGRNPSAKSIEGGEHLNEEQTKELFNRIEIRN